MRHRPRGATLQIGFLGITLLLALWLGYQAVDAATSHRRTVEAALADYAGISAWEFAGVVRSEVDHMLDDVFRPVRRRMRATLPSPRVVGWELEDAARERGCECRGFGTPLALFRIVTGPTVVEIVPDTLGALVRDRLAELVLSQPLGRRRVDDGLVSSPAGEIFAEDVVVGFMISHDTSDIVEAAYGFVIPARAVGELFAALYADRQLLPEPIAGDQPNDSLLFVRVRDESGLVLFASPTSEPDVWSATEPIGPDFGTLVVEATIRPDAAGQLIIGGLPTSRIPLLAVLLVLTLGVGAAALVQIRHEQRFQRLRDDFVSGVSHELRTPLAQIQMFSELQLADKLPSREDQHRAISVIHRESRRLGHLVENILQFSRQRRTPGLESPRQRLDVSEGFADGIAAMTWLAEDRGMHLHVEAESGLQVLANRDALTRIVVNLLDNAVKYGPPGQAVKVSIRPANGTARLTVTDEGPGVPVADRRRIWGAYQRLARDVEAAVPGTGIGLSVVAQLVDQHDGRRWVEDAAERGARFIVELPLADWDVSSNGSTAS
jgi:signal transduction histidine kinase